MGLVAFGTTTLLLLALFYIIYIVVYGDVKLALVSSNGILYAVFASVLISAGYTYSMDNKPKEILGGYNKYMT